MADLEENMKGFLLLLLTFSCTPAAAFTIPFPQFIRESLGISRIPQFILDTRHPWIEANRYRLERLPDVEASLCSLDSPMRPQGSSTENSYPPDLFHRLEINNNRWEVNRPGWRNAILRCQEILRCPAALTDVRELEIQIFIHEDKRWFYESSTPPQKLLDLLTQLLSSMPNLQKLAWQTFGAGDEVFKNAFSKANLTLPSVRHLELAKFTDFFVDICPGIESLQSTTAITESYWRPLIDRDPCVPFIEAAARATNLTSFSLTTDWELEDLQG